MVDPGAGGDGDREQSPFLETVAENVPIVLFAMDEAGVFTRSEGRGLDALGLAPDEVVGESVYELHGDHPDVLGAFERALSGESVHEVHEFGDATFEVWYRPGGDGVDGVRGVAVDVTERVRHERLLEQVNEATRELVVASSIEEIAERIVEINRRVLDEPATVVWLVDPDAAVLRPVARTDPDLSVPSPIQDLSDLDPIEPGTAEMAAFDAGEPTFYADYHAVENRAHPESALGAILAVPIDGHGLLTVGAEGAGEIGASTRDLVEIIARDAAVAMDRVKRESAVERLHAATRELFEAEGREEIAERTVAAAEGILGHSQSVLRLRSADGNTLEPVAMTDWIRETIPDRPAFPVGEGSIGTAFERGEPTRFDRSELEERMANERTRSLLVLPIGEHGVLSIGDPDPTAFEGPDERLAQVLVANAAAALDRVERQEELRRQNERLEQFAGILSHDLRTPLNVISGHLALAREDPSHLDSIEEAVDRMEAIVDDVLELTREGRAVTDPERVALSTAATRAWGTVRTAGASLEVIEDRDLLADVDRLCRLLENLFHNAVEHAGADVRVQVGATEAGFFVEDDGPGVPATDRDRIFEAGHSTREDGTGLGLQIVREIAGAHGWVVEVTDGSDGGARFEVSGVEFA